MTDEAVTIADLATVFDSPAPVEKEENKGDPAPEPRQDSAESPDGQPEKEPEGESEADAEADEVEADAGSDEASVDDEPEGRFYKLPDGQKVTLKELKEGHLRQQDYSRKTQEVAELRKAQETEFQAIRQQQVAALEALLRERQAFNPLTHLHAQLKEAVEIGDSDTANELRWAIQSEEKKQAQLHQAMEWEKEQAKIAEEKTTIAFVQSQRAALHEKMPLLKTEEGRKQFIDIANKAIRSVGYTEEEIKAKGAPDHREAILAYKAGKYDEMLKSKPKVAEALKGKAVAPKSSARPAPKGANDDALNQLRKNPNDALALGSII